MTLAQRVEALEAEVKRLRELLDARPNATDYSGTTAASTQLATRPPRPYGFGYGRYIGTVKPDVTA